MLNIFLILNSRIEEFASYFIYIFYIYIYFGFVNAVKRNKMFEDLTLSSGTMWEYF